MSSRESSRKSARLSSQTEVEAHGDLSDSNGNWDMETSGPGFAQRLKDAGGRDPGLTLLPRGFVAPISRAYRRTVSRGSPSAPAAVVWAHLASQDAFQHVRSSCRMHSSATTVCTTSRPKTARSAGPSCHTLTLQAPACLHVSRATTQHPDLHQAQVRRHRHHQRHLTGSDREKG